MLHNKYRGSIVILYSYYVTFEKLLKSIKHINFIRIIYIKIIKKATFHVNFKLYTMNDNSD